MGSSSDGSIVLKTRVDTSGVESGMQKIKSAASGFGDEIDSATEKGSKGLEDVADKSEKVGKETDENTKKSKKWGDQSKKSSSTAKKAINGVTTALSALGLTLSVAAFVNLSNESSKAASATEASVQRIADIYGEASASVEGFIQTNSRALGLSKSSAKSYASVYGNLFSVWADQNTNAQLTNNYLNMTAVVASKTGRTMEDVQERIRSGLLGNTEAIEDLGIFVNVKTIEITEAFKKVADGRSWEQLTAYEQSQVRTLAILEQSTKKYGDQVAETTTITRARYQAAYEDFKNTWGQVVNTVLMPAMEVATQFLDVVTAGLQALTGISEQTVDPSLYESQAGAIGNSAKNQKKLTDEVEKTAAAQKKALAGFDNINILSDETADSATDSASDAANLNIPTPGGGNSEGKVNTGEISSTLSLIMGLVSLALVAVGLILLFTGNIAWGIGFIIVGAALFAVSMATVSKTTMGDDVIGILTTIMAVAGGALVAIGIILITLGSTAIGVGFIVAGAALLIGSVATLIGFDAASVENVLKLIMGVAGGALLALGIMLCIFAGPSPLSIGLIVAGAVALVSTVALNFDAVVDALKGPIGAVLALISTVLVVIGLIMICTGHISPISIGLLVAGAVGLAAELALNWGYVVEALKGPIGAVLALISTVLVVIGLIMICTGHVTPLSIGLLVAGAVGLATEIALNWNYIVDKLQGPLGGVMAGIGSFLLVLGIILLFTGAGTALGIGLIIAGGGSLATAIAPNWDFIVDKVKEMWQKVQDFWNTYIAPVFTKEFWVDLAKKCANGLISGFEGAINGIIGMFENMINWIVGGLNKISFDVPDWVPAIGGKTFGFDIPKVSFDRVSIPRLATGAVIPANSEFLAVLGDQKHGKNLEAPEDLIRKIVREETGGQHFTIQATGSMAQLIRLLNLEIKKENTRATIWG